MAPDPKRPDDAFDSQPPEVTDEDPVPDME
jgi:hypothetical protein